LVTHCLLVPRCTLPCLPLPRSLRSIRHSMCKCYRFHSIELSCLCGLDSIAHVGLASSVAERNAAGEQMDPTARENRTSGQPWGMFLQSPCQFTHTQVNPPADQTALAIACRSCSTRAGLHPTSDSASSDLCVAS
jgi:hypothetical protein